MAKQLPFHELKTRVDYKQYIYFSHRAGCEPHHHYTTVGRAPALPCMSLRFIFNAETVTFDLAGSPVMAASLHLPSMLDTNSVAFDLVGTPAVVATYSHLHSMFDADFSSWPQSFTWQYRHPRYIPCNQHHIA
jgi:hypothetical protein